MITPITQTVTLAAGQHKTIPIAGRFLHVVSCTVASFRAAFGDDPLQLFYPGRVYPSPVEFSKVRFEDALGGGATIVVTTSLEQLMDDANNTAILTSMLATLNVMDSDLDVLKPASTLTIVPEQTIAQTGVGTTQLLAANANRKWAFVNMDYIAGGRVYLGINNTVTKATSFHEMLPAGSWREHYKGAVWACSANGTELARAYETT